MEIFEAKQLLINNAAPIKGAEEEIVISKSIGRICAEDITSPFSVPSFPKSAMDGYAVNSSDVKLASKDNAVKLKVVDELLAGDYKQISYEPGTAVRVMTGALVPDSYDAVIKQEDTDYGEDTVTIYRAAMPFENYCKVGEDIDENATVISANTVITRSHIGVLASLGIKTIKVKSKPVIGIICTGSELASIDNKLKPGQIYGSISYMLEACLDKYDIEARTVICSDDSDSIISAIKEMLECCDMIITTGGVSVGKKDLIPGVIEELGATKLFYRANIKPGTPTMGSVIDGKVILSLSGNPYAALCNFDYYFWDLLAHISGNKTFANTWDKAILADDYSKVEKTKRLLRAKLENGKVYLSSNNASSVISNLYDCNCYALIDADKTYMANDTVEVLMIK